MNRTIALKFVFDQEVLPVDVQNKIRGQKYNTGAWPHQEGDIIIPSDFEMFVGNIPAPHPGGKGHKKSVRPRILEQLTKTEQWMLSDPRTRGLVAPTEEKNIVG